jgi:hypothetical protein
MPTVTVTTAVGASSAVVDDIFIGIRASSVPNIAGATFQATYLSSASVALLTEELFVGAANPVELSEVGSTNRIPQSPEDIVTTFAVNPGEKITCRVTGVPLASTHYGKLVVTRTS